MKSSLFNAASTVWVCGALIAVAQARTVLGPSQGAAPELSEVDATATRSLRSRSMQHVDPNKVYFATPGDGATWARTEAYKVSFARDSVTYIPFLGSSAPEDYPIAFRLLDVSVGGVPIGFDADVDARRTDDSVQYARGNITETYELAPRTVEQEFTVSSLPNSGDLVLRLGLETGLQTSQEADGLRFSNDLGYVTYDGASAVDARGLRSTVQARLVDGQISITVPASFLARAAMPVTIDPTSTPFPIDTGPEGDSLPDIAFGSYLFDYLVAYERAFSASDHDIYCQFVPQDSPAGAFSGEYIDITTNYWAHPAVGDDGFAHKYLVAAQVGLPSSSNRTIWGVIRDAYSTTISGQFEISDPAVSGDKFNVVVGTNPFPTSDDLFAVVWERVFSSNDHDVHGQMVRMDATRFGGNLLIDNSTAFDTDPSISRGNDTQDWDVVWQREITTSNHDVFGARLHWDGSITAATFAIDNSADDTTHPAVSTPLPSSSNCLVAYEQRSGSDHDIVVRRLLGTLVLAPVDISAAEGFAAQDQIRPSVDCDGLQFVVAYSERTGITLTHYDAYAASIAFSEGLPVVGQPHVFLGTGLTPESQTRIASVYSGGAPGNLADIVWDANGDVQGNFYVPAYGGQTTTYCFGDGSGTACPCGNTGSPGNGCANSVSSAGGSLYTVGSSSLSTGHLHLFVQNLPANGPCLYFEGTTRTSAVFGDGLRCVGGSVTRLAVETINSLGGLDFPVPVSSAPAGGGTRDYQVWYRNAGAFCTPSTFNLTNGVEVVWVL